MAHRLNFYWHDLGKKEIVLSDRQQGEGKLKIWAQISEKGRKLLYVIKDRRNAEK